MRPFESEGEKRLPSKHSTFCCPEFMNATRYIFNFFWHKYSQGVTVFQKFLFVSKRKYVYKLCLHTVARLTLQVSASAGAAFSLYSSTGDSQRQLFVSDDLQYTRR